MNPAELIIWLSGYEAGLEAGRAVTLQTSREQTRKRVQRFRKRYAHMKRYTDAYLLKNLNKKELPCNVTEAFERFWLAYPKRKGSNPKHTARLKFLLAVGKDKTDPEAIISAVKRYTEENAKEVGTQFICMASTWLNQRRWQDYPPAPAAEIVTLSPEKRAELIAKHSKKQAQG